MKTRTVRLLVSCPDKKGIVAAVSSFLFDNGANIIESDQYATSRSSGVFFIRIEFEAGKELADADNFKRKFGPLAEKFDFNWTVSFAEPRKKMVIFGSLEEHCVLELLWRWKNGELPVDIPYIISNHEVLKSVADQFGVDFKFFKVDRENREKAEQAARALIRGKVDFIVLARYMQILTGGFVDEYRNRIINIHHSFLPAFAGAKPYEQAYQRGVKIIGATSHYVTEELDRGPIIEQDVERVTHKDNVEELKRKGKDIERTVLFRAVKWHAEDRIIVYNNRTIVFA
ncbi:MAG: formyltetrahydrofolate deformylase [Candidatus Aureabacteria bacterium]|nr:formyltetrahydrofolate deformylase [Candidatus Auribacterota bacterium]